MLGEAQEALDRQPWREGQGVGLGAKGSLTLMTS